VISTQVPESVAGARLVKRLDMVPVECIGRAYLAGSGFRVPPDVLGLWRSAARRSGRRVAAARLDLHPTSKAPIGQHDQPMTYAEVEAKVGSSIAASVRKLTIAILERGNEIAAGRGILLADTKVEFA